MEAVAEGDDDLRVEPQHQPGEPAEGLAGVVGRQELAAAGVGRALFEMQVGDDQHAPVGPPQRPLGECLEHHPGHADEGGGRGRVAPSCVEAAGTVIPLKLQPASHTFDGVELPPRSFPRKREPSFQSLRLSRSWIPACAGMSGAGAARLSST